MRPAPWVCGLLASLSLSGSLSAGTVYNQSLVNKSSRLVDPTSRDLSEQTKPGSDLDYIVTTSNSGLRRHTIPAPAAFWPGLMTLALGMILIRLRRARRI